MNPEALCSGLSESSLKRNVWRRSLNIASISTAIKATETIVRTVSVPEITKKKLLLATYVLFFDKYFPWKHETSLHTAYLWPGLQQVETAPEQLLS